MSETEKGQMSVVEAQLTEFRKRHWEKSFPELHWAFYGQHSSHNLHMKAEKTCLQLLDLVSGASATHNQVDHLRGALSDSAQKAFSEGL